MLLPMQPAERHSLRPDIAIDAPAEHGGDLAAMRAAFSAAPLPWLDLSTGINPWPYPVSRIPLSAWHRLPEAADVQAVRVAAAAYYGVSSADQVVLAPGSQAIIQWLPRLRGRSRVAIVGPTYAEHARSWAASGHDVVSATPSDTVGRDIDVVVVGRPNNPDGRIASFSWLEQAASRLGRRGGWLVVDEAFADCLETPSVTAVLRGEAVISLRSFGKFFGLAGGRLGAALTNNPVRDDLAQALGPWCVPGPMLAIAGRAYADQTWIARTRTRLAQAAARLDRLVTRAGLRVVGGTTMFRLYESVRAPMLFDALAAAGIYVRRFEADPTWLRLGLPPNAEADRRLAQALAAAVGKEPVDPSP